MRSVVVTAIWIGACVPDERPPIPDEPGPPLAERESVFRQDPDDIIVPPNPITTRARYPRLAHDYESERIGSPPPPPTTRCACEPDADKCDFVGDVFPPTTDICQTWSNVRDGTVNLYAHLRNDPPLVTTSVGILGYHFDEDNDFSTPEDTVEIFEPNPNDAAILSNDVVVIGYEDRIRLELRAEQDQLRLDMTTTLGMTCADIFRAGRIIKLSFPRTAIEAETFRLGAYTYGTSAHPDLGSVQLYHQSRGGAPDIADEEFQSVTDAWSCNALDE
jgi:hypothetical protein